MTEVMSPEAHILLLERDESLSAIVAAWPAIHSINKPDLDILTGVCLSDAKKALAAAKSLGMIKDDGTISVGARAFLKSNAARVLGGKNAKQNR